MWGSGVQDTKLEIHGCDGQSYHAVLQTRFCIDDGFPASFEQQMVEWVRRLICWLIFLLTFCNYSIQTLHLSWWNSENGDGSTSLTIFLVLSVAILQTLACINASHFLHLLRWSVFNVKSSMDILADLRSLRLKWCKAACPLSVNWRYAM